MNRYVLRRPTANNPPFNNSDKRFLVDVFPDPNHSFIYNTRLLSEAARDNNTTVDREWFRSLVKGRVWETEVKAWLIQNGLAVTSPDFTADDKGEADLIVNGCHVVEVKSYGYKFNSPETFPYPEVWTNNADQTLAKYELANKLGGSLFFIIVSQITGAMVGFRYDPKFFTTNQQGKTVGKCSQLLTVNRLLPYLSKTNNPSESYQLSNRSNNKTRTHQTHQ